MHGYTSRPRAYFLPRCGLAAQSSLSGPDGSGRTYLSSARIVATSAAAACLIDSERRLLKLVLRSRLVSEGVVCREKTRTTTTTARTTMTTAITIPMSRSAVKDTLFRHLCIVTIVLTDGTVRGLRGAVSYTHLRAHETRHDLVCRLLLEKKK